MSEQYHTEGPWDIRRAESGSQVYQHWRENEYASAVQSLWYICGPRHDSDFVADVFVKQGFDADAVLMAAAPDLLRMCRLVLRSVNKHGELSIGDCEEIERIVRQATSDSELREEG